jgi:hypothetical protein
MRRQERILTYGMWYGWCDKKIELKEKQREL